MLFVFLTGMETSSNSSLVRNGSARIPDNPPTPAFNHLCEKASKWIQYLPDIEKLENQFYVDMGKSYEDEDNEDEDNENPNDNSESINPSMASTNVTGSFQNDENSTEKRKEYVSVGYQLNLLGFKGPRQM